MDSVLDQPSIKTQGPGNPVLQTPRGFRVAALQYGPAPQLNPRGFVTGWKQVGENLQDLGGSLGQIGAQYQHAKNIQHIADAEISMDQATNDIHAKLAGDGIRDKPDAWVPAVQQHVNQVGQALLSNKDLSPLAKQQIQMRLLKWGTQLKGQTNMARISRQFDLTTQSLTSGYMDALNKRQYGKAQEAVDALQNFIPEDRRAALKIGIQDQIKKDQTTDAKSAWDAMASRGDISGVEKSIDAFPHYNSDEKAVAKFDYKNLIQKNQEIAQNKQSADLYKGMILDLANGKKIAPEYVNGLATQGRMDKDQAAHVIEAINREAPAPSADFNDLINQRVLKYDPMKDTTGGEYESIMRAGVAMGMDQLQAQRLQSILESVIKRNATAAGRTESHQRAWANDHINDLLKAGAFGAVDDTSHVMGALGDTVKMQQWGLSYVQAQKLASLKGPERIAAFQEMSKNRYKTDSGMRMLNINPEEYNKLSDWTKNLLGRAQDGKLSDPNLSNSSQAAAKAAEMQDHVDTWFADFRAKNARQPTQKEVQGAVSDITKGARVGATWKPFPAAEVTPSNGLSIRGFIDAPDLAEKLPDNLAPHAADFIAAAKEYNLNPKMLAAISMHETDSGTSKAFKSKNNAMGVSNSSGPIAFSKVSDSIFAQAKSLAGHLYKGANTVDEVGRIYAPVGAENDPTNVNGYWPGGVASHYAKLK